MRKIIALSGFARCGKSTLAHDFARQYPEFIVRSFATPLKQKADATLAEMGIPPAGTLAATMKEIRRPYYVFYGKVMRKSDPNYWLRQLANLDAGTDQNIIIDDLRYANEAEWVTQNKGLVVYVMRPDTIAANDEELVSISRMRDIFHPKELLNDHGIPDAANRLDTLVRSHFRGRF